ncbi:hypothetical protein [Caudoviricetes sp.]|nr:hypothetical protein [Caudoviricetes sp.]
MAASPSRMATTPPSRHTTPRIFMTRSRTARRWAGPVNSNCSSMLRTLVGRGMYDQ